MQSLAGKPGARTTLKIGAVTAKVILHGTVGEAPKLRDYATAGPHGRELRYVQRAELAKPADADAAAGDVVPVQKGSPMTVGTQQPAPESDLLAELQQAVAAAPKAEAPSPEARRQMEDVITKDIGPGAFRQVMIEAPGEGESEDDMPELSKGDLHRGIRQADGVFIDLTSQLADIEQRTKLDTMEVVSTMDVGQVPRDRVLGSLYVGSDSAEAPHVLRVTMEAMRRIRRVLVVAWTVKSRQSLGVVTARRDGAIVVLKLAWAEDVREPGERQTAHLRATAYEVEVDAMAELLGAMSETKAEGLDTMRDAARELREELDAKAEAGELAEYEFAPAPQTPVSSELADMLRESYEHLLAGKS